MSETLGNKVRLVVGYRFRACRAGRPTIGDRGKRAIRSPLQIPLDCI